MGSSEVTGSSFPGLSNVVEIERKNQRMVGKLQRKVVLPTTQCHTLAPVAFNGRKT